MKISAYQPTKKTASGMYRLYYVYNHANERAHINTHITTLHPIIKVKGGGIGFTLDRREPAFRAKMKRLEELYWRIDEYAVSHPGARASKVKDAIDAGRVAESKKKGILNTTMEDYCQSGKISDSTADIIKRTTAKIEEYDPAANFSIDEEWLDGFSSWLTQHGAKTNGIALHLRNIRTVFNWARRRKLTKEYPFLDYQIKHEKISIKNMTLQQIRVFKDYPCEAWQQEYRDIFMLIVYLAGINIGDLLLCKSLTNGRLVYQRQKTGASISVPVFPAAMEIIERYKGKRYLLSPMDRYKDYHGYTHRMNDGLKKIGEVKIVKDKVGKLRKHEITPVFEGLSTYVARYTFASLAAECGINRDVIAACLGHSWADVTSHYIAYNQQQIDAAVKRVVDYINGDYKPQN